MRIPKKLAHCNVTVVRSRGTSSSNSSERRRPNMNIRRTRLVSSWRSNSINNVLWLSENRYRTDFCTAWGKSVRWCPWTVGKYFVQHCHDFLDLTLFPMRMSSDSCAYLELPISLLETLAISWCVQDPEGLCTICLYFLASLLTSWDEVHEKLSAASLVKFPAFYTTWNSVTVFQFLPHAIWTHSVPSNPMSLRSVWI